MNYCLSINQSKEIKSQVAQVRCQYNRIGDAIIFLHDYPDKSLVLDLPSSQIEDINFKKLEDLNELSSEIYFCIHSLNHELIEKLQDYKFKFYYYQPATSYNELISFLSMGVSYVSIVAPLAFDLNMVTTILQKYGARLRLVPNVAQLARMYYRNGGLTGFWIHPAHMDLYEPYVDTIEFVETNLVREKTFWEIYAIKKDWTQDLNILIRELNVNIFGNKLRKEFTQNRLNCKQECLRTSVCHRCDIEQKLGSIVKQIDIALELEKD